MEHTIYLDILFCVNFVVDYILLLTVRRFLSLSCRRRRLLAGAAAGGLLSCVILLPPMPFVVSLAVDILSACIVVAAAFAPMGRPEFIRTAFVFFAVSFVYCGMMMNMLSSSATAAFISASLRRCLSSRPLSAT